MPLGGGLIIYLKIKVIVSYLPIKHYFDKPKKAIYAPHSILIVERGN